MSIENIYAGYFNDMNHRQQFYSHCIGWEMKFVFLPKKCFQSGKKIWLELAYKGVAMWTGPGDPVFETQWHNKQEHLIWLIKR